MSANPRLSVSTCNVIEESSTTYPPQGYFLASSQHFQVTSMTYAGATQTYTYDNDGLLITSGDYTLTRDAQNAYTTKLSDGTLTQNRSYNNFGEVTQIADNTFSYQLTSRDNTGAITQKVETLGSTTVTYDYTYDKLGRPCI